MKKLGFSLLLLSLVLEAASADPAALETQPEIHVKPWCQADLVFRNDWLVLHLEYKIMDMEVTGPKSMAKCKELGIKYFDQTFPPPECETKKYLDGGKMYTDVTVSLMGAAYYRSEIVKRRDCPKTQGLVEN